MNTRTCNIKNFTRRCSVALIAALVAVGGSINTAYADDVQSKAGRPKVALVLGGGGTRGAAHVGVLRVLQQEGVQVDMVVGTSMGAIVGGLYCAGLTPDKIETHFDNSKIMKNYMTVPLWVRAMAVPFFAIPHLFGWHPYDGFYFGNKVRNYLESCLPEDKRDIEKLSIPYHAVSTNLVDGKQYIISKGNVARAMQASSAIPVLRRPVPMDDGSLLVDGFVVANVPADAARKLGADVVIAVDVDEQLGTIDREKFRKIGSVAERIEQVTLAASDSWQLKLSDIVIHPNVDGIGVLSLKPKDAKAAIKAGEEAARTAMTEIKAKLNLPDKASVSRPQAVPN